MEKTEAVFAPYSEATIRDILTIPVIVASLGYFVDIYDLILFSIVDFLLRPLPHRGDLP